MQHAEQLAPLKLVENEKETAAAKRKAPSNVCPSTPAPSIVACSLSYKNGDTRRFLKSDISLVSEKGDKHDVSVWLTDKYNSTANNRQSTIVLSKQETKTFVSLFLSSARI